MIERWIEASAAYLGSARALESLDSDPYWPKWDSPWWHACLLWELGRADRIPKGAAKALLESMNAKWLDFFPNPREPLPPGRDGRFDAPCHCALGIMHQVLRAAGEDVDAAAPWIRPWFLRYQLPEGGLNCDEKAYEKGGASSVQSTLPVLEALLSLEAARPGSLSPVEEELLDGGAEWLLARRLAYRRRDGKPMDEAFLRVGFPRFYDYDVLRGLAFVARWARVRGRVVAREAIDEQLAALDARFPDGRVRVEKPLLPGTRSYTRAGGGREEPLKSFPLLDAASRPGAEPESLSAEWREVRSLFLR